MAWWGGERKESPSAQRRKADQPANHQSCSKAREGKLRFSECISIDGDNYNCPIPNFFWEFYYLINPF